MNSLELQEKLLNFQKKLRMALKSDSSVLLKGSEVMRQIDYLLCMHVTWVKPLRVPPLERDK